MIVYVVIYKHIYIKTIPSMSYQDDDYEWETESCNIKEIFDSKEKAKEYCEKHQSDVDYPDSLYWEAWEVK